MSPEEILKERLDKEKLLVELETQYKMKCADMIRNMREQGFSETRIRNDLGADGDLIELNSKILVLRAEIGYLRDLFFLKTRNVDISGTNL